MTFHGVIGLYWDGATWSIEFDADHVVELTTDQTPLVERDDDGRMTVTFA